MAARSRCRPLSSALALALGLALAVPLDARGATPPGPSGEPDGTQQPGSIDPRDPATPGRPPQEGAARDGDGAGGSTPAPATEAERRARARELHDQAKELYVEGRYREALDKLVVAAELDPQDKDLHYVLAFVAEKLLELDLALEHYRASAELEQSPFERERLANVVRRVERARDHLKAHPRDARQPGLAPVAPAPPPSSDPTSLRLGAYVTAGVGGTALAVAAVAGAYALYLQPEAHEWSGSDAQIGRLNADADKAYAAGLVAEVAGVLAGLSLATAVLLALLDADAAPAASTATLGRPWRDGVAGPPVLRF
jgi:hypothetical protein